MSEPMKQENLEVTQSETRTYNSYLRYVGSELDENIKERNKNV